MADSPIQFDALTYNSMRSDLIIPEYGRSIHRMIEHCLSMADRDQRTQCAKAIVSVMGSVVPAEGEGDQGLQKLWNQLHIMANYELDVDGPFPKPEPDDKASKPAAMDYPNAASRAGHFGKTTLDLIEVGKAMEEGEEKAVFVVKLANLMKRHFLTWNQNTVEDSVIFEELKKRSGGALVVPEGTVLEGTADILRSVRKTSDALARPQKKKKKRR
ncbi:MAG: DUF4290 domain-containing protein [Bacteroidetes bacterium]|nr:DUF4290 domain-containing protein [Bacteroidota bacterium]MDA0903925.1 DUF4290 domain-containing protein [Bacteroidota bacterium]MDA1242771.1 DUF4290 domain-containing protein [Bacteroidota bacterium]